MLRSFWGDVRVSLFDRLESQLATFVLLTVGGVALAQLLGLRALGWVLPVALAVLELGILGERKGWRQSARSLGALIGCFVVGLAFFPTPSTDATAYHYPAIQALSEGWNPIYEGTEEALLAVIDTPKPAHITLQSKATWYFASACFTALGVFDSGTALGILALVIGGLAWFRAWRAWFPQAPRGLAAAMSLAALCSPWCLFSIADPLIDGAAYHLTLALAATTLLCLQEPSRVRILETLWLAVLLASMKLTALLPVAALCGVSLAATLWRNRQAFRLWWGPLVLAGMVFLLLNVSPLVTNAIHHGSPLYPVVTFGDAVPVNLTADFDEANADRERMGRSARWAYAFVSKAGVAALFRKMTGQAEFRPTVLAPEGIEGFGPVFRGVFPVLSILLCWLFLRQRKAAREERWAFLLYWALVLTSFVVPMKYLGYGRYVFGLYLAPFVGTFLLARWVRPRRLGFALSGVACALLVIAACRLVIPSAGRLVLLSVQNTMAMAHLLREKGGYATFLSPERDAIRLWLESSYPGHARYRRPLPEGLHPFALANFTYTCGTRTPIPLPAVRFTAISSDSPWTNYDRAAIARRLSSYMRSDFLPWLLRHPFAYPKAILRLRWAQLTHCAGRAPRATWENP